MCVLATGTILVATLGAPFPASFALSLNVPMVHSAILLDRSQVAFPFSKHLSHLGTRQIMMHPAVDSDLQMKGEVVGVLCKILAQVLTI